MIYGTDVMDHGTSKAFLVLPPTQALRFPKDFHFPGAGGKGLHSPPMGSAAILEPVDANAAVGLLSDATSKLAPTAPPAKPENIAISAGEDNLRNVTRARPPSGRRQPRW